MAVDWLRFHPPVIAHRGASLRAPENTLPAFALAADEGARWAETDVKLSQDGIPILMHDDRLERTTNGAGAVATTDWAEIEKLDAGGWKAPAFQGVKVPRLNEALRLIRARGMRLNLELKPCPGRARVTAMVALMEIARLWPEDDFPLLLSSFDAQALSIAAQLQPAWPRGLLLDGWAEDWAEKAEACRPATLHPDASALDETRMRALCGAGLPVIPYVVNDAARARELLRWGATAVFTDCPKDIIAGL